MRQTCHLLAFNPNAQIDFLEWLSKGAVTIENIEKDDLSRIKYLIKKYQDLQMDFADACLVFLGEKLNRETRPEIIYHYWDPQDMQWPTTKKPDLIFFDPPYFTKKQKEYRVKATKKTPSISSYSKESYEEFFEKFFLLAHRNVKDTTRIALLNADWRDFRSTGLKGKCGQFNHPVCLPQDIIENRMESDPSHRMPFVIRAYERKRSTAYARKTHFRDCRQKFDNCQKIVMMLITITTAIQGYCIISNNIIINNTGGIKCPPYGSGGSYSIFNNIIKDNTGYGIYCRDCTVNISNNIISNNAGGIANFNVYPENDTTLTLSKNSIINNMQDAWYDSILYISDAGYYDNINIDNNLITVNLSSKITYIRMRGTCSLPTYLVKLNHNNIFNNSNGTDEIYDVYNNTDSDSFTVDAENNWWGVTNKLEIQAKIYDFGIDSSKSIVDFDPWLEAVNIDAPISPPTGLTATAGAGEISLNWAANPESDTDGYKVYWVTNSGHHYSNCVDVGYTTSHTITGLVAGKYYIAVTAYDTIYLADNDDANTIVNDNQTNGNESWFSQEVEVTASSCPNPPDVVSATPEIKQITINWNEVSGATSYNIYWSETQGVTKANGTKISDVNSPYIHSERTHGVTYYYVVTSENNHGESNESSEVNAIPCSTPSAPNNPTPSNGATGVSINTDLDWAVSIDADSYDVYFGTSSNPVFHGNSNTSSYSLPTLEYNTQYYWKIVAKNICGNNISGSVWSFTTEAEPCASPNTPSNPAPSDGQTDVSINADLDWADSIDADSYDVYFSTSSNPPYLENTNTNSYSLSTLNYNTQYYWKIVAKNTCGNSTSGAVWSFTTEAEPCAIPNTPSNPVPSDGQTGVSINADLDWADSIDADSYDVYFGTSSNPPYVENTNTNSYSLSTLNYNTQYYWKIVAKNTCDNSASGAVWSFTTEAEPVTAPLSPTKVSAVPGDREIIINWDAMLGATSYNIYMHTSPDVSNTDYTEKKSVTTNSYIWIGLTNGTTYYFVVTSENNYGESSESNKVSTTPLDTSPPTVIYTGPFDGAINLSVGSKITAIFSKDIDPNTVNSVNFFVNNVNGTVHYLPYNSGTDKVAIFIPTDYLSPNTTYTATITTGIKDLIGNPLPYNYSWSFTTSISDAIPTLYFTTPITHTLHEAGDIKYYQFNATGGEHLFIQLADDYNEDNFNLYIRHGSLPTAAQEGYDYTGTENEAVEIFNATEGIYYIMVKLSVDSNPWGANPGGLYTLLVSSSLTELILDQSITHTLPDAGDIKYYQFNATDGEHFFIQLADDYNEDSFNLYIKHGSLPTTAQEGLHRGRK